MVRKNRMLIFLKFKDTKKGNREVTFLIVFRREEGIRTLDMLPYTRFPSVRLQPLGHLSKFISNAKNTKKIQLSKFKRRNYDNSPRIAVSNMVLNTLAATFCPNKYINLVIAASVVMSFPEIIPISFSDVLAS
jgi:hypothetical protein